MRILFLLLLFPVFLTSQNIDVNNDFDYILLRYKILSGEIDSDNSFNIRPIHSNSLNNYNHISYKNIFTNKKKSLQLKFLGIDYFSEYNSSYPYKRNNGIMLPNKGFQHVISPGIFIKTGPLSIKIKPEQHYSDNKKFDGFWEGHYPIIWAKRYRLWNHIDMPERFGEIRHNSMNLGQSSIRLNWKNISVGFSSENIWWGPAKRNSIMMSNNSQGFKHLTFNTVKPINTFLGSFEWQLISGKLEQSGYNPPNTEFEYAGTKLFVPKINQNGKKDDWRYFQGYIISFSPKIIDDFSIGFIRWVQMYAALVEGKYWWMEGNPTYFPVFSNLFRKKDKFENYEAQTNQAAGIFFRWLWKESKAELYAEFHHNDSKQNLRDLLLDADHSRAATIGIQKLFNIKNDDYLFEWEWTQMEQNASRLIRNAGSWYEHRWVYDGYTHKGEVLGSAIGPGSNSHYLSFNRIRNTEKIGLGLEIIDHDNDFYHIAFASARDYRRYWKDFNLHLNYNKSFKSFNFSSNFVYTRSLNYQWELDDFAEPYYHPGKDINNFHLTIKLTYFGNW